VIITPRVYVPPRGYTPLGCIVVPRGRIPAVTLIIILGVSDRRSPPQWPPTETKLLGLPLIFPFIYRSSKAFPTGQESVQPGALATHHTSSYPPQHAWTGYGWRFFRLIWFSAPIIFRIWQIYTSPRIISAGGLLFLPRVIRPLPHTGVSGTPSWQTPTEVKNKQKLTKGVQNHLTSVATRQSPRIYLIEWFGRVNHDIYVLSPIHHFSLSSPIHSLLHSISSVGYHAMLCAHPWLSEWWSHPLSR
jgi:hypothetical protein